MSKIKKEDHYGRMMIEYEKLKVKLIADTKIAGPEAEAGMIETLSKLDNLFIAFFASGAVFGAEQVKDIYQKPIKKKLVWKRKTSQTSSKN